MQEPPAVTIEPMQRQDAAGFRALAVATLAEFGMQEDPLLDGDLQEPLDAYLAAWVARSDGDVVGTVALQRQDDGNLRLRRMFIAPELRGRGVGRALLDVALERARSIGAPAVHLQTLTVMAAAQHLYESAGFRRAGEQTEAGERDSRCEFLYRLDL
jgi:putative acetyltransferase